MHVFYVISNSKGRKPLQFIDSVIDVFSKDFSGAVFGVYFITLSVVMGVT